MSITRVICVRYKKLIQLIIGHRVDCRAWSLGGQKQVGKRFHT